MFGGPQFSYHQTYSARDWLSILRTHYPTQNLQRKHTTDSQMTTKARKSTMNPGSMIAATEMKLLRPLAGYSLYDNKTNDYIRRELRITGILDKAKNATKPNPFEIIPLQTTRKEYNWKTEEALARAALTLETERIKESNPWCLWWWWWWW